MSGQDRSGADRVVEQPRDDSADSALKGGVALIPISTESPLASRADALLSDLARKIRRLGIPSRVFQVHLHPSDEKENQQRLERLIERVIASGCQSAVFGEIWIPELGLRLRAAGIELIETRAHTFEDALLLNRDEILAHVGKHGSGPPLDELANLVEIVGPRTTRSVTAIDLLINHSCGYKGTLADNPFYRDVFDAPEVARHRGCGHCLNALRDSVGRTEDVATQIVERIRHERRVWPTLDTLWMAFAETFYDALAIAFRTTRGDPVWSGITLAMQCRPDVIAQRAKDIEALAADAAMSGTTLRIGVVGFENFSPREILVLNRGASPDDLDAAATILNRWSVNPPTGLVARGFTPSFILFTPWTTLDDLEINLQRIALHGLWNANIERLRIGPGTPAFVKAQRAGLVADGPVRAAAHPNGYSSEREIQFADRSVAMVSAGFERLRPLAFREQPELLAGVLAAVRAESDPQTIDWDGVAQSWKDVGIAATGA